MSQDASPKRRAIRVLLAKPGLDGHDRGIKVIVRALRDAGMEVIYLGMRVTPEAIALAALQEDVDAVGLSNLSGAYSTLFPAVADALRQRGAELDRLVLFGGGTIPPEDHDRLRSCGFRAIFGPEARTADIARFLETEVAR